MFLVDNRDCKDPSNNLAFEEYCFKYLSTRDQSYFILYENDPSVVVGKHQNTYYEINHGYTRCHRVKIVRRISGGGAVFHGKGNLNFSFITPFSGKKLGKIGYFLRPIADFLSTLGVRAELTDKNDILVNGRKVSGSAQFTDMKNVLTHGTLLFDADLESLRAALKPDLEILSSAGIDSRRASVTNIADETSSIPSFSFFREGVMEIISRAFGPIIPFSLPDESFKEIERAAREKYDSWEWTYGKSPHFCVRHRISLNGAFYRLADFDVKRGVIQKIRSEEGLFLRDMEEKWIGKIYDPALFFPSRFQE